MFSDASGCCLDMIPTVVLENHKGVGTTEALSVLNDILILFLFIQVEVNFKNLYRAKQWGRSLCLKHSASELESVDQH